MKFMTFTSHQEASCYAEKLVSPQTSMMGRVGLWGTLVAVREDRPSSNARHRHHALVAHVLDTGLVEMKHQIARLRRRSTFPGM